METETEAEPSSILQLPLFTLPPIISSELLASPLHTAASVPFQWEEEPGKPRQCTSLSPLSTTNSLKCLELPPRLLMPNELGKLTKTPSPTTVLEGPYVGRSIFHSSSLRFPRNNKRSNQESSSSSFDGGSGGSSPDRGLLGSMVLINSNRLNRDKGFFGSLRRRAFSFRGKRVVKPSEGDFVFYENEADDGGDGRMETVKVSKMTRKNSLLGLSQATSHFWATVYGAIKQVLPRRSTTKAKWKKKDAFST
ncbi:hypothetical protein Ancab_038012 [Ancistrocladus abbreviatus]